MDMVCYGYLDPITNYEIRLALGPIISVTAGSSIHSQVYLL